MKSCTGFLEPKIYGQREKERERERQNQRETERKMDRQIDRQRNREKTVKGENNESKNKITF